MRAKRVPSATAAVLTSPWVIFLIAMLARLRVLFELLPQYEWRYFYQYNEPARIAWSIVSGHGYSSPWPNTPLLPTAQQPPVYPYLLAAIFKTAGAYSYSSLWIAVLLNAIFSAITALLILRLGRLMFGVTTGALAAWVWAVWIYEAAVSVRLWESSLSALLLVISLLLLRKLASSPSNLLWLGCGVLGGFSGLTNTTFLAVFPVFFLWLWARDRRAAKPILFSVAIFLLMLMPWTVRNYEVFHRVMPIRDNLGLELWMGNHEGVTHQFPRDFPAIDPTDYNRLGELRFMQEKQDVASVFIRQHPSEFIRLSAARFYKFWTDPQGAAWGIISLLAWIGLITALWRKPSEAVPYGIVLIIFPAVYYVTHVFSSYRHPIEPVILLLASYAAATAIETARAQLRQGARNRVNV